MVTKELVITSIYMSGQKRLAALDAPPLTISDLGRILDPLFTSPMDVAIARTGTVKLRNATP